MRRCLFLLLAAAAAAMGADDPWLAVTKIKTDTEIRVLKKGVTQPVLGKFYEANDEHLVLVVKNDQIAIAKDQIDRVDARPAGGRVTVESRTTTDDPQAAKPPDTNGMDGHPGAGSGTTTKSGVSVGGRPDFETVYRRSMGAPKNPDAKK
jgi:hypothetical protein